MASSPLEEKKEIISVPLEPIISCQVGEIKSFAVDTVNAQAEYTNGEYKRLLRKIDWFLLPLMWVAYGTQQADKTSISVQVSL